MGSHLNINPEHLQVKGLTRRWLINIIGVVVLVIILAEIILSFFVKTGKNSNNGAKRRYKNPAKVFPITSPNSIFLLTI